MQKNQSRTIDLTSYKNEWPFRHKLGRWVWGWVWLFCFRPSPRLCFGWRRFLLRLFGARIGRAVRIYPSCRIWAPWMLEMGDHSWMGPDVDCYTVDKIHIGANAVVSQYSFLCTASHDIRDPGMRLTTAPVRIGASAWVAADVFVGPGVAVGPGAVCAVRAVVLKNVPEWTVVGGNPAKFLKMRDLYCPEHAAAPGD